MLILVTGGAGFIGSHIVDRFVEQGHSVVVLDDLSSGSRENLAAGVELKVFDICSAEARQYVASLNPDVIVHAAAQISVRLSMEDPSFDTQVNVLGLVNLLQAFQGEKLPYFAFISTGGALYGEQNSFPADEQHAISPTSVYGLAKYTSELYLDLWSREMGLEYVALRLGNVYGPRQNPHGEAGVVAIFCETLLKDKIPTINGDGKQTRDFVYVSDVADAVSMAVQNRVKGSFNIGTSRETNVNQIYQGIAGALNIDTSPNHGPAKPGEQLRSCIDCGKAKEVFGWDAKVELEQGLRETAEWFREAKS